MPKKKKVSPSPSLSSSPKPRAKKGKPSSAAADPQENDHELYKRGVLIRGEAAKRGKDGKLPPGVTHEIAKNGDVVRVRYSMV
jgi:hypothetical protein